MPLNIKDQAKRPITIEGTTFEVTNGYVNISDLHFWEGNPRIYSLLDKNRAEGNITKNIIFEKMKMFPDFNKLKEQIRKDSQINDPLWVCKNPNTGNYTVYEGNTRLAVAIQLSENDKPSKRLSWQNIQVNLLPDGTDERVIKRLIGLIHLVGVNAWAPFEADGYYFREIEDLVEGGLTLTASIQKVANNYGVATNKAKDAHKLVSFMLHHNMSPGMQKSYYSYWQTIIKTPALTNLRKLFNDSNFLQGKVVDAKKDAFDKMLIKKVTEGVEVQRVSGSSTDGTAFRDDIKSIANAYNEKKDIEIITDLIDGNITIQRAVESAKEGGIGNVEYEKVRNFNEWLCSTKTMKNLQNAVIKFPELKRDLNRIKERAHIATMKLEKNLNKKIVSLTNTDENHLVYKICILMMLADKVPHKEELKHIEGLLIKEHWVFDIDNHDIVDAVDQVSVEIFKYGGILKTANIYGKLLKNKNSQQKVLKFIEEIMFADNEMKKEETSLIKQLRNLWT